MARKTLSCQLKEANKELIKLRKEVPRLKRKITKLEKSNTGLEQKIEEMASDRESELGLIGSLLPVG